MSNETVTGSRLSLTAQECRGPARAVGALLAAAVREEGQRVSCGTHDPAVIRQADQVIVLAG